MKKSKQLKVLVQTIFAAVAATVMMGGLASTTLYSAETNSVAVLPKTDPAPASTNSVALKAKAPDTGEASAETSTHRGGALLDALQPVPSRALPD